MATTPAQPTIPAQLTIRQSILDNKRRGKLSLVPFVPAGYPDLQTTVQTVAALARAGAAVIEIGFPFSDPIADGPIIQEAFTAALATKIRVKDVLEAIATLRGQVEAPLAAMISYSIVFRYGQERFFADLRSAGFSGVIIPDLPPPEAQAVCKKIDAAGLESILLVAPTTPASRREEIARLCTGFVYYLSVSGITGERDALPSDLGPNVALLRTYTDTPVCVGFGLHSPAQMSALSSLADGAIVGSAIVRRIKQHRASGPALTAEAIGTYVQSLANFTTPAP